MNSEEIKEKYSMRSVVEQYGFHPDRAGFIHCPFHKGDKGASMKIYQDSYYCFGCGATGDIFSFVQQMEHCDFKTAFRILGGTYEAHKKTPFEANLIRYRRAKQLETRQIRANKEKEKRALNNLLISVFRDWMGRLQPLSQGWTDCYNSLQKETYKNEMLEKEGDKR